MNVEAEVLGAILLTGKAYWSVADLLTAEDFAEPVHADLWDAISRLSKSGVDADAVMVGDRFPNLARAASELAAGTASAANVRAYAEAVANRAVWRRVKGAGLTIAGLGQDDAYGEAQRVLNAAAPRAVGSTKMIREFFRGSVHEIQRKLEAPEEISGVPSGIERLDDMTCGWQAGDMIVLAARPSIGKTAMAIQWALEATKTTNVLFFSLEMSGEQLSDRVCAHLAGIDHGLIRRPKRMPDALWPTFNAAGAQINEMRMAVNDTPAITAEAMASIARQWDSRNRLGLIVIDYLSYMAPPKANTTNDAIQMMTRSIKATAKAMRVPIILLCQLNRGDSGKPTLKSLRDSGAVEQDADVVVFLHPQSEEDKSNLLLIVAKQRNGPCGEIPIYADRATQRFELGEFVKPESKSAEPKGLGRLYASAGGRK